MAPEPKMRRLDVGAPGAPEGNGALSSRLPLGTATSMQVAGDVAREDDVFESLFTEEVSDARTFLSQGARVIAEDLAPLPVTTQKAKALVIALGLTGALAATPSEVSERSYRGHTYPTQEAALAARAVEAERVNEAARGALADLERRRSDSAKGGEDVPLGRHRYQPEENPHGDTTRGNPWQGLWIAAVAVGLYLGQKRNKAAQMKLMEQQRKIEELPDGY